MNYESDNFRKEPKKLVLSLAIAALLLSVVIIAAVPSAKAVDVTSYAFLSVEPNPVGVTQLVLVTAWIEPLQPTASDIFHNLKVTITHPDGNTETKKFDTTTVGSNYFTWTPTAAGNYIFKLTYPGETYTRGGYHFTAAESPNEVLVVQQDPIPNYQDTPMSTDYWTRPINGQNRLWGSVAGDWLIAGYNATGKTFDAAFGFNPYTQAPRSAHIMWTQPLGFGGIAGGDFNDVSFYPGLSYESKAAPGIIMDGKLYYNIKPSSSVNQGFVCVDLRTGQTLWKNDANWTYSITLGQEYAYNSGNQGGVAGAYLWQTSGSATALGYYRMFDAFTGNLFLTFNNAISGTNVMDKNGNWYVYVYRASAAGAWLAMWNFTRAINASGLITYNPSGEGMYRPTPRNLANPADQPYNWLLGVQWNQTVKLYNVTVPDLDANGNPLPITSANIFYPSIFAVTGNNLVTQIGTSEFIYWEMGYSLADGHEVWAVNRNSSTPAVWGSAGAGEYIRVHLDTRTHTGYNANTGEELWTSDEMGYPWGSYGSQYGTVAYGKFFWGGYDGVEYAFDISTGHIAWNFSAPNSGYETPYGSYPFWYGPVVGGGVVFVGTGEHSPTPPFIRGERMYALDAQSGKQLWNITGLMVTRSIADGYLITYNGYDNQLYCFGKGPSATTVQAPLSGVVKGSAVTITGTVTDQSSGQVGTAAIADADMGPWMEYLKEQQPLPTGVTIHGVPVTITVTAPDGTSTNINTASDMSGHYGISWTPATDGLYKITTTFTGSDSYGSSYDETYVAVGAAAAQPSQTPAQSPTPAITTPATTTAAPGPAGNNLTYVYVAIAAVIIVVAIVAAAVMLRRRK
jgi:hypothetical protein